MDHFTNPRNVGEMPDADGIGEQGNPVCGDAMKIYIKVKDNIITDAKFQTFGCGAAIAVSSMITESDSKLFLIPFTIFKAFAKLSKLFLPAPYPIESIFIEG